jgi:hypothetical protein
MSAINDGGPAFPRPATKGSSGSIIRESQNGMTLRDYFAGQALAGQLALASSNPFNKYHQPEDVAPSCYRFADAMLAEREATK